MDNMTESFGRLTVIAEAGRNKRNRRLVRCRCTCGNECVVIHANLASGNTKSCGCWHREATSAANSTHRASNTKLWSVWNNMRQRCYDPNCRSYQWYGARGIKVCTQWFDFATFKTWALDNGYTPGLSIDRINTTKGYRPDNCRWATAKEQANNRRSTHRLTFQGETKSLMAWSEDARCKCSYTALRRRVADGWFAEEAIMLPVFRRHGA